MRFADHLLVTRSYLERRLKEVVGQLPKGETVAMEIKDVQDRQKKLAGDLGTLAADQKTAFGDLKAKIDKLTGTVTTPTPEQQAAIDDLGTSLDGLDQLVQGMDTIAKAADPGTDAAGETTAPTS